MKTIRTCTATLAVVLLLACVGQSHADVVIEFNVSGTLSDGDPLGGTVTIDTTTGTVLAANITAVVPETLTLNSNVGGIPDYGGSTDYVIVADSPGGTYPITLLGLPVSSLVGYDGGPIVTSSNVQYADGSGYRVTSGTLTYFASTSVLGDTADIFNVSGTLSGGGTLGGQVTIDEVTGTVLAANITAVVPETLTLNSNVGGIPDYGGSTDYVIVADSPGGTYPITLLGLPVSSLVGYDGGPIVTSSNVQYADGSGYRVTSGELINPSSVPEPSTFVLSALGLAGLMGCQALRRRKD